MISKSLSSRVLATAAIGEYFQALRIEGGVYRLLESERKFRREYSYADILTSIEAKNDLQDFEQ